jgi:hypothetical protein
VLSALLLTMLLTTMRHEHCCGVADAPMGSCPLTSIITGGKADSLKFDGLGSTVFTGPYLPHTVYEFEANPGRGAVALDQ